ncbi:hypothetical protein D910_01918 [Dendroctonus ponderosae]|uniref:Uncharacterized protein n=1 Tax=Dendroctonus ponderosae TaxID=77166 RepID=U4TWX4_DENPD|nr:hypothetical protein D910_01918 [Dendroctonus ponderosae]
MLLSIALMIKGANSGKKLNCMAGIKVFACVHLTIKSAVGCTWYPFPPIMSGSTLMDHNTTHITYPFIFNWSNVVINEAKPFSRPQTESLSNILMNLPYRACKLSKEQVLENQFKLIFCMWITIERMKLNVSGLLLFFRVL